MKSLLVISSHDYKVTFYLICFVFSKQNAGNISKTFRYGTRNVGQNLSDVVLLNARRLELTRSCLFDQKRVTSLIPSCLFVTITLTHSFSPVFHHCEYNHLRVPVASK